MISVSSKHEIRGWNSMMITVQNRFTTKQLGRSVTFLVCLLTTCVLTAAPGFRDVNVNEAAELLMQNPDIRVLDVRTGFEFRGAHLENAVNLNYWSWSGKFEAALAELDKDITWLVLSRRGGHSSKALPIMKSMGFTSVVHLTDGTLGWQKAGLPLVRGVWPTEYIYR